MEIKELKFKANDKGNHEATFVSNGKATVFIDRNVKSSVDVSLGVTGIPPIKYQSVDTESADVILDVIAPAGVTVVVTSYSPVLAAKYVDTSDVFSYDVPASSVKFDDGETFQDKLDAGTLKGDKGDTGPKGDTGAAGAKGTTGAKGSDGKSVTGLTLTKDASGNITSGTCTLSDGSSIPVTVTTATA